MSFAPLTFAATQLACRRGGADIFEGVSFRLSGGESLTVRGPNGSGKSSLLRVLGALVRPSAGALVCDLGRGPVGKDELAALSHLVGHRSGASAALGVAENLRFQTALLGGETARVDAALERAGLKPLARQRAHVLSAGQNRRLALARLMTVARPVWLLDEPMESLDAEGETLCRDLIAEHLAAGGVLVLATHGRGVSGGNILTLRPAAALAP